MARRRRRSGVSQLLERDKTVVKLYDLRSKFHVDVRRSLSSLSDLRLRIAQFLLYAVAEQVLRSGTVPGRLHDRVEHGSHGQPQVDRTRSIFPSPPPPLRDACGLTRWIVDQIMGYEPPKTNRDQARLRIRWRGFPPHRDTWEPRNVLMEDVPELVRAYEAQHGVQV
ncbi:hypothetical protein PC128_g3779 [Phytophthora cactorum]|nr:hypothetical protein PC128_g3779 [Phytophthora cactorum]